MYVKYFCTSKIFRAQVSVGFQVFKITISKMCKNWLINRSITSVFVLVYGIVFNRSNGLIIKCLSACLMN